MEYRAYLDIETTGLSPFAGEITVVGLHIENDRDNRIIQLVGEEICPSKLIKIVKNTKMLYTYNGSRFDLPFIREKLKVDLTEYCLHKDLMYSCWERNLYGGLKEVERQVGIKRKLPDVDGRIAVQLWLNYKHFGDRDSLIKLLKYNEEDVLNLRILRQKLNI
jgi:uncharacterized protein YprB with RNaseH-like and TPR domain